MLRLFKFMFFFSLLIIVSCAGVKTDKKVTQKTEIPALHKEIVISPSRAYEECIELLPTHVMEYSFKASKPLTFNIHYHTEEKVFYPVLKEEVSEWSGTLNVVDQHYYYDEQEFFCLMWENAHSESVNVTFECKIRED